MRPMNRRTLIALGLSAAALPAVAQDQRTLTEVSKYLNQLRSVQGRFTQVNVTGSQIGGQYFMVRPGRIRFEYDGGDALVVASGLNIAVFDRKGNPPVPRYPRNQTPLRFLLQERIDLTQSNLARDTASAGGLTTVTLQDPRSPRDGSMALVLRNSPPSLAEWTVTDSSGQQTRVVLQTLEPASNLSPLLFNIEAEARNW